MSLVDTLMQSLRTSYSTAVDKNEIRESRYGALQVLKDQTSGPDSIVTEQIRDMVSRSMGNQVFMPVLDAENVSIGNTRSCTITDSENTSKLITLTFVTLAFGFTMTPSQHYNNDISYEQDWQRKMKKYLIKLQDTLDEMGISLFESKKNTVWPSEVSNTYPVVANALQVSKTDSNDFYNQLSSIMKVLDFYNLPLDIVANAMHESTVRRNVNQGASNDENDAFQFALGYDYNYTNNITNRSGVHSTIYGVAPGTVAMLNRNDPDALAGHDLGHKAWGTTVLPGVDMTFGTYFTKDCSDRNTLHAGTGHLTRTLLEGFEFSTDIVLMSAYNSNPAVRANPIVKAELWAGDSAPV